MRGYNVALFIHVLGAIGLFVAFGVTQLGGARLRRAKTPELARQWSGLLRTTAPLFPASLVLLLAAGLYMANDGWSFSAAWIVVALIGFGVISLIGPAVIDRGCRRMGDAASREPGAAISPELRRLIADPATWVSLFALNGMAIGIVWLMTMKPDWAEAIIVPTVLTVAGAFAGRAVIPRTGTDAPPIPRPEPPSIAGGH
jgi:hypothetical protein